MVGSSLRNAAERHRSVASLLSNPHDRAILNGYADEVEDLAKYEVTVPSHCSPMLEKAGPRMLLISSAIKSAFQPDPDHLFNERVEALDRSEAREP
jgi:hypothetical protein